MHVVFGHVIKGQEVVDEINMYGTKEGKPSRKVTISDCGVVGRW
jgi:peptidylprolyl isomerase